MTNNNQVVAGMVANSDGKYFLLRRCGKRDIGKWEFPAGSVDPGEFPTQAMSRELQEEANLDVQFGLDHIFHREDTNGHDGTPLSVIYLAASKHNGWECGRHKEAVNFDRSGWFTLDEAKALDLTDGARNMIGKFRSKVLEVD